MAALLVVAVIELHLSIFDAVVVVVVVSVVVVVVGGE